MIYLMRTKERMEKSAARHKIQSNMAKRVLLYGIRKEYSLKELPAIGKGIYGKPYFPEYPEICFNYSHADAGILCGIAENRKCITKGGELDYSKAAALLIDEFRSGKLGKVTLEWPKEQENG